MPETWWNQNEISFNDKVFLLWLLICDKYVTYTQPWKTVPWIGPSTSHWSCHFLRFLHYSYSVQGITV